MSDKEILEQCLLYTQINDLMIKHLDTNDLLKILEYVKQLYKNKYKNNN